MYHLLHIAAFIHRDVEQLLSTSTHQQVAGSSNW
jgi:hypothetical protein